MARKALLQNNAVSLVIGCFFMAATSILHKDKAPKAMTGAEKFNWLPAHNLSDTLSVTDPKLEVRNGIYFWENKKFTGVVSALYPNSRPKYFRSVMKGMMHGQYASFYESGDRFEVRQYIRNMATGRHYGYWPDGKTLKFDYNYNQEKRQGMQKKWYKNGRPYLFAHFKDDHEDGLQQGWRENGKLFLNYVAKDGHTYGLQQSALCYTLLNQKIKGQ